MISPRPYQAEAHKAVITDWHTNNYRAVLVTMATGLGKTFVFLSILNDVLLPGKRGLTLAHRKELIEQPLDRLHSYYPDWRGRAGIVMGDTHEPDKQLIIATVQSLASSPRRLDDILSYGPIDYLVTDECFVSGTIVNGKQIEKIKRGDFVTSWYNGVVKYKKVVAQMKRYAPDTLYKINAGNNFVVCTGNHPFMTVGGWKKAKDLNEDDRLLRIYNFEMPNVWKGISPNNKSVYQREIWKGKRSLFKRMQVENVFRDDGKNKQKICQRSHEEKQSHEKEIFKGENETNIDRYWTSTERAWREWSTIPEASFDANGKIDRMGIGISRKNYDEARKRIPAVLQSGHCEPVKNDCRGSRWIFSQHNREKVTGQKERRIIEVVRVDGIEIFERGRDREFRELCQDNFVYNLEVEDFHTYTANGFIVHNCHHVTDKNSYAKVLQTLQEANPDLRHLGVTATPIRADGDGLGGVYEKESYHMGIVEGIKTGYLAPVRWLAIQTRVSLASVATSGGDFVKKQLKDVFETDNCFDLVVETHKKYADGRQSIAFTVSVEGAYSLAEKFNAAGISAAAADGTTDKDRRRQVLADFIDGKTAVLCNVGLYTEGLDVPQASCIHQVRPTRSDGLYTQMVGRALRPYPGKDDALVLDYAPIENRNIAMMGDVLGVPLRKEAYIQEDKEEGEAAAGFLFDGNFNYLKGNPADIISRQLDYLDISPWCWYRKDGWMSLGLGEASDGKERTLIVSPPQDGEMVLYGVAREKENRGPMIAYKIKAGSWDVLGEIAEDYANRYGNATLAAKSRRWRREAATDAQIKFARRIKGAYSPGMKKGELAQSITHHLALREVQAGAVVDLTNRKSFNSV